MKYRGLTFNRTTLTYEWVYGMPSYGYETEEIAEIGTPDGEFFEINPATLGEETDYRDRHGKPIYTGDITTLKVDGEVREFVVDRATVDREYWIDSEGIIHQLLPCVDDTLGACDCHFMEIIDTVAERAVRESESKGEK